MVNESGIPLPTTPAGPAPKDVPQPTRTGGSETIKR